MLETLLKFSDGEICEDSETGFYTYFGITANQVYHKVNELKRKTLLTERQILLGFLCNGKSTI